MNLGESDSKTHFSKQDITIANRLGMTSYYGEEGRAVYWELELLPTTVKLLKPTELRFLCFYKERDKLDYLSQLRFLSLSHF